MYILYPSFFRIIKKKINHEFNQSNKSFSSYLLFVIYYRASTLSFTCDLVLYGIRAQCRPIHPNPFLLHTHVVYNISSSNYKSRNSQKTSFFVNHIPIFQAVLYSLIILSYYGNKGLHFSPQTHKLVPYHSVQSQSDCGSF